uniref:ATP synthase subunit a n=1 Tax=Spinibdella lignicola TaxID=2872682 RepID=A0A977S4S2_9ACAR|nr:ATP synthase F0 subunit 6 [Spinibdella lignicola]UXN44117.1 ATP synthase F0 subunit 6 [Spinibdella lignicola]
MFDPSSSIFNINWLLVLIYSITTTMIYKFSKLNIIKYILLKLLYKETSLIIFKMNSKMNETILLMIFYLILMLNFFSMFPFNWTLTAHLTFCAPMALISWLAIFLFNWTFMYMKMITHSVPSNTPYSLLNFMIIIEMISNMIRPITLSIRLTANMVAGHLLLNLMGSVKMNQFNFMINMTITIMLSMLEIAMAFIQAYVFMILLTLYSSELTYAKKK